MQPCLRLLEEAVLYSSFLPFFLFWSLLLFKSSDLASINFFGFSFVLIQWYFAEAEWQVLNLVE